MKNSTSKWNPQFYPKAYINGHLLWIEAKFLAKKKRFREAILTAEKLKLIEGEYTFSKKKKAQINFDEHLATWKQNQEFFKKN